MASVGPDDSELLALRELSSALGADPSRTQGAGGNTSIKRDGAMWIKASGTWLAEALHSQHHDSHSPGSVARGDCGARSARRGCGRLCGF